MRNAEHKFCILSKTEHGKMHNWKKHAFFLLATTPADKCIHAGFALGVIRRANHDLG